MGDFYKEWLIAASDDLETISEIIANEHLTNIVAFHAQQCIEKSFKAVVEKYLNEPKKTHNILKLYQLTKKYIGTDLDEDLLEVINDVYIESRYPGDLGLLPNGKPSLEDAKEFYEFAKKVFNIIKTEFGND